MTDPFCTLAALLAGLRDRTVAGLNGQPPSAWTGELLGGLAGLVTRCRHLSISLERLQQHDAAGFDAFRRALGASDDDQCID